MIPVRLPKPAPATPSPDAAEALLRGLLKALQEEQTLEEPQTEATSQ